MHYTDSLIGHPMKLEKKSNGVQQYRSYKGDDFNDATGKIIQAAIEVHKNLGPGFMEVTYQRALALELRQLGLDFDREVEMDVYYKDQKIDKRRVDFLVEDCMVEIKGKSQLEDEHYIQTLSYLKASNMKLALLINFGAKKVQIKRFVR